MCPAKPNHEKIVRLIRRIAREVAYEVIDEHLEEYEHKEKQPQPFEIESGEDKPDG